MKTRPKERRRHIRYRVNKNVLSISQNMLAEVLDISTCGMGCQCLAVSEKPLEKIDEIEILNCEIGTSVEGIPCKLVRSRERAISDALTSTIIINFGVEFQNLTESQRKKLHQFIRDNSLPEATAFL